MPETTQSPVFKPRIQEALLAVLFVALLFMAHDLSERAIMLGVAILQLVEGRVPAMSSYRYRMGSVLAQLLLAFLLIGITGGVNSAYFLLLLLPVVSSATWLGVAGTLAARILFGVSVTISMPFLALAVTASLAAGGLACLAPAIAAARMEPAAALRS